MLRNQTWSFDRSISELYFDLLFENEKCQIRVTIEGTNVLSFSFQLSTILES
jgi:hypothetical protein